MQSEQWIATEVTVSIRGMPLTLKLSLPDYPVKPQVMLPLFQQLSDKFTGIGVQVAARNNKSISCKQGCIACCKQPIPLSEIEIYHVSALVDAMPEPRRSDVKARFAKAAWRLYESGWYERFEFCKSDEEFKDLAFEYIAMDISCPFLENNSCSVYASRPIICREYLVTSPSERCSHVDREDIERLELPASATHGSCRVGKSSNMTKKNFQLLVFALMWAEQYPEPFAEKTGAEWLGEFLGTEEVAVAG